MISPSAVAILAERLDYGLRVSVYDGQQKLLGHAQVLTTALYAVMAQDWTRTVAARITESVDGNLSADLPERPGLQTDQDATASGITALSASTQSA